MKAFATILGLSLVSALSAQSTLSTITVPPGANTQGISSTMFFNMTVSAGTGTISVTKLDVRQNSPAGTQGKIRFWQTIPGFGFSGSETNRERWQLLAEGNIISTGLASEAACCFETPVVLTNAMGTRGYAVEYLGVLTLYTTGNGTNQTVSNSDLTISLGAVQQNLSYFDADTTEVGGVAFHVGVISPRVFNGIVHYSTGAAQPCAYSHKRGTGCGADVGSWYSKLYSNAQTSSVLTGNGAAKRSVTMLPDGLGGYTVLNTTGGALISTAGHNTVVLANGTIMTGNIVTDDGENLVPPLPMSWSFPANGGPVSQFFVNTNGTITTTSLQAFLVGTTGVDWAPRLSDMLNGPTGWYCWHDFDLTTVGAIRYFDTGSQLIITFEGVPSSAGLVTELNTFQFTFDQSGTVTMFWDTIDPNLLPYYSGIPYLVGYSHNGASIRPLETNLANPAPGQFGQWKIGSGASEVGEMQLSASPRPVGSPVITYTHTNVQFAAQLCFSIGNPFGPILLAALDPSFTQPQCLVNFDFTAYGSPSAVAGPGVVVDGFTLDTLSAALLGVNYWVQAVGLTQLNLPNVNPDLITSNALHQRVENN